MPDFKGALGPGRELVTLATRHGVTVRVLLMTPNKDPTAILVYFPGGGGTLIGVDGRLRYGRFVSVLSEQPFITAVVDRPSDRAGECRVRIHFELVTRTRRILTTSLSSCVENGPSRFSW